MGKPRPLTPRLAAVDVFCGAGGLTHGLIRAGIPVVQGIDLDTACEYPSEANNDASFILRDVAKVEPGELARAYPPGCTRVLVGCAPCQPFSRYARGEDRGSDGKWVLLGRFARLVEGVKPAVVSMENVPELSRHPVFDTFLASLRTAGYHVTHSNVFCPDYGIPQQRTRLVLFASLAGPVSIIPPTHTPERYPTVEHAIAPTKYVRGAPSFSRLAAQ